MPHIDETFYRFSPDLKKRDRKMNGMKSAPCVPSPGVLVVLQERVYFSGMKDVSERRDAPGTR